MRARSATCTCRRIRIGQPGLDHRARGDQYRAHRSGGDSHRRRSSDSSRHARTVADHDQPSKPVSGGDLVVQSGAGRVARRGGRAHQGGDGATRHAREHRAELPGHGPRVRIVAGQRIDPDPRRDRHRLHRARHAVRELSSTRSRFFRRCRRPASAQSWRWCCSARIST